MLIYNDPKKIGMKIEDKEVMSVSRLENQLRKHSVKMAILTLHASDAQKVSDILVKHGVKAIWNFTSVYLDVPEDVFVWNENLAASFIMLSRFITRPSGE